MFFEIFFKKIGIFFKNLTIIHFFVIFLASVGIANYFLNNTSSIQKGEEIMMITLSEGSKNLLPDNVIEQNTEEFDYLFSQFDLKSITVNKRIQTIFTEGIKKYLIVYEINGGLELYLKIKELIEDFIKLDKESSVFEANNLGMYSFYYNNSAKKNTVYLVALIRGKIWAFEYPKSNHEEMKMFTKSIADGLK